MFFISKNKLNEYIEEALQEKLGLAVRTLDKDKYYIMVVPESINVDELRKSFNVLSNSDYNIVVVASDKVNLIELG